MNQKEADLLEQIDLLDSAPKEVVGIGGVRISRELRRLMDMGVVKVSLEGDQVKIRATPPGKILMNTVRGFRGRI